jgi:hypothetical protein
MVARLALLLLALWAGAAWGQDQGAPEWRPPVFPPPERAVRLAAQGVQPDTGADVAAAINAVLRGLGPGQALLLQPGTYRLSAPLLVPAGVTLQGPQDKAGQPLATLEATHVFRGPGGQMPPLVANAGWMAEAGADRGIRIRALRIRHETYGVMLRRVEDAAIEGCAFEGGMDATAILAGRRTRVAHNLSHGTRNAAWDHWNGTEDAVVEDNIAFIARGHGILFNAVDSRNEPRTSRGFVARRNVVRGVGPDSVGIWVSPLGRGGGRIAGTITIEDNDIAAPQPGARSAGILVRAGDAELVVVRGNRVAGVRGYPAIAVGPNSREEGGSEALPARVVVEGNDLRGNLVSRTGGVVRAWGVAVEVRGNRQEDNGFLGGGAAPGLTLCARSRPAQEPVAAGCGAD